MFIAVLDMLRMVTGVSLLAPSHASEGNVWPLTFVSAKPGIGAGFATLNVKAADMEAGVKRNADVKMMQAVILSLVNAIAPLGGLDHIASRVVQKELTVHIAGD